MSSISIKGIIIGALFDVVASVILGAVALIAIVVSTGVDNIENITNVANSGLFAVTGFAIGSGVSVLAGYIAARIAGRGELINGALSSILCVVMSAGLTLGTLEMDAIKIVEFLMTPLLGLLGGYLRSRQVRGVYA